MAESKSITARLSAKDAGFTRTMSSALGSLKKFSAGSSDLSNQATRVKGSIGSIVSALGIYKLASKAASTVTNNLQSAMSRQDTLYLYQRNLKQMGYDAKTVQNNQNQLSDAVTDTAYALDSAANSTQSFSNAGISLKKSTDYSVRFMDLISRYGDGTNQTYKQVMLQMNQMASKGKANLGDIKSAVEAQIPVWKILSDQTGQSVQDIQDDITNGKWTSEEFFDALMAGSKSASGAAKDGAKTWAGSIGIMKSRMALGVGDILTSFKSIAKTLTGDEFGIYKSITAVGTFTRNAFGQFGKFIEVGFTKALPYIKILQAGFNSIKAPVRDAVKSVTDSIGKMTGGFLDSSGTLNSFSSLVYLATTKIRNFADYISKNADKLVDYGKKIAKLWAAFKGYTIISNVLGELKLFSQNATRVLSGVFDASTNLDSKWRAKVLNPLISAIISGSSSIKSKMGIFTRSFSSSMNSLENKATYSNVTRGFASIRNAMVSTFPTFSRMSSSVAHPIKSLANLSATAGGSVTAVNGASLLIGNGFKKLSSVGVSAIGRLSTAMLTNPITAVLLLITAGIAGAVNAWQSNFMNVQGYAKKAFGGIVSSLKSVMPSFESVKNVVKDFGKYFKWLGVGVIAGTVTAVAGFVDALRLIITVGKSAVKTVIAVGDGLKGAKQALSGDFKGAAKSFGEAKKQFKSIGNDWKTMFSESAVKKAIVSTDQLGKKSKETAKGISMDMKTASGSVEDFSSKLDEAKQAMTDAFSQENGSTAGVEAYFKNTLDLVTNMKDQQKKAVESYNKQIESAEGKSESKKQEIYAKASSAYMKTVQDTNSNLLSVYNDYSNQLKTNKTVEGQELNEQQRSTLQNQTNIIRDQLIQQNQEFVNAGVNKLQNKQQLSIQEQQQAQQSLQTLGQIQTQQIQENDAQIQQLTEQKNQAKTASEQAAFQNQISQLQTQNAQIRQSEIDQGAQLLAIISQNGTNNVTVTSNNLAQLKSVTDQQLLGLYQSYVASGASVEQQMALLAGVLRQKGIDGSNGFVQGLQSNDPSLWASMSKADIINTLQALPPDLFRNGQDGKNQLVSGLQSGKTDLNNVGKELMTSMNAGQDSQKNNSKRSGADNGSASAEGTKSKKNDHKNAGKGNAQAGVEGEKSEKANMKNAGLELGQAAIDGLLSQKSNSTSAGRTLGDAVKSGAGSIDMSPIGSNMAKGIASGIRSSQGDAVSAMQNLVSAVNAEAKKKAQIKSPSRLLKKTVGVFLAQGVAAGIDEDTSKAVQSARNMITNIQKSITGSSLVKRSNAIEVKHEITGLPMKKMIDLLEKMQNLSIIMDTGALVGELGTPMNNNLGEQQKHDGRYR